VRVNRKRIAIGPVAQHGIESVGDGDDACPKRNLFTAQTAWIAGTIKELMVGKDDIGLSADKNRFVETAQRR